MWLRGALSVALFCLRQAELKRTGTLPRIFGCPLTKLGPIKTRAASSLTANNNRGSLYSAALKMLHDATPVMARVSSCFYHLRPRVRDKTPTSDGGLRSAEVARGRPRLRAYLQKYTAGRRIKKTEGLNTNSTLHVKDVKNVK